jgi:hypothetical protein
MKKIILSSFVFLSFSAFASVGENHSTDNCRLVNQGNRTNIEVAESGSSEEVRTNGSGSTIAE